MIIRPYTPQDLTPVLHLFYTTVHTINAADYTPEILDAWAPKSLAHNEWQHLLSNNYTLLALIDDTIVGFGTLHDLRYIHYLFTHAEFQGQKIGSTLYKALEAYAQANGIQTLIAEATITSRPFFEKQGFLVTKKQKTRVKGHNLENFVMKKNL